MHNTAVTLIAIWCIAIFLGLCVVAVWLALRARKTDDESTYGQFDPAGKDGAGTDIRFTGR